MAYGGRTLLQRTTLTLDRGHRYGLVGANGAGKSTLLRNLAARKLDGLRSDLRVISVQVDKRFRVQGLQLGLGALALGLKETSPTTTSFSLTTIRGGPNHLGCSNFH